MPTLMSEITQPRSIGITAQAASANTQETSGARDRKSTRLNSSHMSISYAVFCLKKKREQEVSSKFACLPFGALVNLDLSRPGISSFDAQFCGAWMHDTMHKFLGQCHSSPAFAPP